MVEEVLIRSARRDSSIRKTEYLIERADVTEETLQEREDLMSKIRKEDLIFVSVLE